MCRNLASQGFNILIIARNKDKIKEKLNDLYLEFPHIKTGMIIADFSELKSIEDYKKKVMYDMEFYDVGVLVLNAGCGTMGPFGEITDQEVESIVNVNALHVVYMTKLMVPVFVERFNRKKMRGAIIVTSSGFASRPISGSITYSATKTFASFIAEGLNHELKEKIDFLSYQAGEVTTKMIYRYKTDARTISTATNRAAQVCFRDLGCEQMTRGSFRHEVIISALDYLPISLI